MLTKFKPKSIFDMSMITAALRPSGESYRDDLINKKINKNPSEIIDDLLKDNNGYLIYQEDVIAFLTDVCGFDGSKADNTRRAIARKDPEALALILPEILEGYCSVSNKDREISEKEALTFLKIIEDASSYMFGKNHSIGYCMIGYLCAYLRYYHPYEFITSYLNNANNEEDVIDGQTLAKEYGISITRPKFGLSKSSYMYSEKTKSISKGIGSIKYLNDDISNVLYDIGQTYIPSFIDLLKILKTTTINTRQLEILIKLNFFSDFGNPGKLLFINECFIELKSGDIKQINKIKLERCYFKDIVEKYSTDISSNGTTLKNMLITDIDSILYETQEKIMSDVSISDISVKDKIQAQLDYLGYVDIISDNEEDKRKLLISDVKKMVSKSDGKIWGYSIKARSIYTGKESSLNVYEKNFSLNPFEKGDIITVGKTSANDKGYWYIWSWKKEY